MARIELIPERFMDREQKNYFMSWLLDQPMREIDRKEMYVEWCRANDCELRVEDVKRVYGPG